MKHKVKRLKDLAVALKELEPHIRDGRSIRTRREFKSIRQRPRELLGNRLLAAVACATRGEETVHIYEDPFPHGDGMLVDAVTDEKMFTEHVYARAEDGHDAEALVMKAFEHKAKEGELYARGRTLIIYSDAPGDIVVARLAAAIKGKHHFKSVWLLRPDAPSFADGKFVYTVADLGGDVEKPPYFLVALSDDFTTWEIGQLQ